MSLLRVNDLYKAFGGVQAVNNVSFELAEGELLAMIGPNGAGKSTCFNLLNGQLKPDRGRIEFNGEELTGLPPRAVFRRGVGRTFQITASFGSMTVLENVQVALLSHQRRFFGGWKPAAQYNYEAALALLEQVGMANQAQRACNVLAYGDLKRVELAVALANKPRLLLMDEPTAGMAPAERQALMQLTVSIVRERNMAVLFTEHDMDVVFEHAERIIVLNRGQLIAQGAPVQVRADPGVRAIYLGTAHA